MNHKLLKTIILILFFIILIKTAWICGDAYHGFVVVDNLVNGHGLRYNIQDRVQIQTSNLWIFVMAIFYSITREAFFTVTFLNILLSMIAMYLLLFKLPDSLDYSVLIGALILCFSKAFTDFSTSGLENSLTHLLVVLFFIFYFKNRVAWTNFIGVLLITNRMDTLIITLPILIFMNWNFRKQWSKWMWCWICLGIWELFLIFYYGFALPNTYYLKGCTGIPQIDMIKQGLLYFGDSIDLDPITLLFIFFGIAVYITIKFYKQWEFIGIVLYLLYVIKIGGCFMSGRFFVLPLLVTVILFSRFILSREILGGILLVMLLLAMINPYSPIKANANYGQGLGGMGDSGIADERGGYYKDGFGLLKWFRGQNMPRIKLFWDRADADQRNFKAGVKVRVDRIMGPEIFMGPRELYVLSNCALSDAMRSRLPALGAINTFNWRIGHFDRPMIEGEADSIFGENVIKNPDLHEYWDHLKPMITDPLFDWNRIKKVWNFNIGKYDHLIRHWKIKNGYIK